MNFRQEEEYFQFFKERVTKDALKEYKIACDTLHSQYNSAIYENRFITGGAVEFFTYALLQSAGIPCNQYSNQENKADLILPKDKKLSIKSNFTGKISAIRLINKLGTGPRTWDVATLFVFSKIGIVFGTPNMISADFVQDKGDALTITGKGLRQLISNKNNIVPIDLDNKPPTVAAGLSSKASEIIAKNILKHMHSEILFKNQFSGIETQILN